MNEVRLRNNIYAMIGIWAIRRQFSVMLHDIPGVTLRTLVSVPVFALQCIYS
jgi:hypothetical protein